MATSDLSAGDRVEFFPHFRGQLHVDPRRGTLCTVLVVEGRKALVRFEDGEEREVPTGFLTWVPSEAELEAQKAELWAAHLRDKRASRGPIEEQQGRPRRWHG